MHYIQNKILHTLSLSRERRYSELKPNDIESNHFVYHLKQLINGGLVFKGKNGRYALTAKGRSHADKVSLGSFRLRSQPKIVNLIVLTNLSGEYLLYRRKHQPFIGLSGFPYGKIHLGESTKQSSERELAEKTNLHAKLKHRGDVYITVYEEESLLVHTLFHVHSATSPTGSLKEETPIGYCYWAKVNPSKPEEYFPGFIEIYKLLQKNPRQHFFDEYTFRV